MPGSNADSHDLDKLVRWSEELEGGNSGNFPVYAVFLVGPEDGYAHDVFREYRSRFENLGASYQHLMIFGQHGVSTTELSLLEQLGHSLESLPMLALFTAQLTDGFLALSLAGGPSRKTSGPGSHENWRGLLGRLEDAAGGKASVLDFESVPGITSFRLIKGPMGKLVKEVLERVSPA